LHSDNGHHVQVATVHEDETSGLFVDPLLGCIQTVVQNQERTRVKRLPGRLGLEKPLFGTELALDKCLNLRRLILIVDQLGRNKRLEVLVHGFRRRDDHACGKRVLNVKQKITSQEGFTGVLLSNDHDHGTFTRIHSTSFFDHLHVEFLEIEVLRHLVLLVVYFLTFPAETSHNGKGSANDTRIFEDPSYAEVGRNALVNEDDATVLSVP
jgi:hypothetical protein